MTTTFWIQFLGVIFGVAMLYFSFVKYKKKELRSGEFSLLALVWTLMIIIAIVPYALDFVIAPLNFYRRLDFFVVVGFFVLLGFSFYNFTALRKVQNKMEKIVRKRAISEVKKHQVEQEVKEEERKE